MTGGDPSTDLSPDAVLAALWDSGLSPVERHGRAEAALDRARVDGATTLEAAALIAFAGSSLTMEGDYARCLELATAARRSAQSAGDDSLEGLALYYVGFARECLLPDESGPDDIAALEDIYGDALDKIDRARHPGPYGACLTIMARFALNRGDLPAAAHYCRAAEASIEPHYLPTFATVRLLQADIALARDEVAAARYFLRDLAEAGEDVRGTSALVTRVKALLRIGELSERLGEIGAAREAYEAARDAAAGTDQESWAGEAERRLGELGPR